MPKLIVELSDNLPTETLMYADKPPLLGGKPAEINLQTLYKTVRRSFVYSNALFSRKKHAPYLKKNSNSSPIANDFCQAIDKFGFADTASLVICNMGELGHGVFAAKDFEPGECFILYAGIITTSEEELANNSDYAFSYDQSVVLTVDAAETGNIARFIQHMPLNFNQFRQNNLTIDYGKEKVKEGKQASDFWQWRNLVYKSHLTEDQIAWANLSTVVLPLNGVPRLILFNYQKISRGQQLGFSYGNGYWLRRQQKPALFDLKGGVIPDSRYGYKEILVNPPLQAMLRQLPGFEQMAVQKNYTAEMFQQDLNRRQEIMQPVWFSHLAEPVSIFMLRKQLLKFNVIGEEYAPVETEFVQQLRNLLPKAFEINMYERNPGRRTARPVYDIICTTDDLMKWSQLTLLLKSPILKNDIENKCLKLTQEIIIMDITSDPEKQRYLLLMLGVFKQQGHFDIAISEAEYPSGPTRGDASGILELPSEEALQQVIRHNPDTNRQAIESTYSVLAALSGPEENFEKLLEDQLQQNKDTVLANLTSNFFDDGVPAQWREYPSQKLTGKYVGHQVRFFTLPPDKAARANPFAETLKQWGFSAELKKAKEKPSIVVDLTTSKLKI